MTLPRHVAIIMDGNGRWAASRGLPRHAGHKQGVEPVRMCVRECLRRGIGALTLFAFSSENWGRPGEEVSALMGLFMEALDSELDELGENGVRLAFIGDRQGFPVRLQSRMSAAEKAMSTPKRAASVRARSISWADRSDAVTERPFSARPMACVPMPHDTSSTVRLPGHSVAMSCASCSPWWRTLACQSG